MKEMKIYRYLYWIPRLLGVAMILFLAIFSLDVFTSGKSFGYYAVALFMHLIPNFILAILLAYAWKYEKIGGVIFILLAFIFTILFKTYIFYLNFFLISFPIFLIGGLFILNSYLKNTGKKI